MNDNWISVEDRLPEITDGDCSDYVLCWDKERIFMGYLWEVYDKNYIFMIGDDQMFDITHWQPLPNPPKETD